MPIITKTRFLISAIAGAVLLFAAFAAGQPPAQNPQTPVLVELFTSEGCSDCPPADALLARLEQTQPVAGAQIVVLSEHVDYWNHLGWADPFSSAVYSQRQSAYAQHFGIESVYTPQMIVDGNSEFVGSDEARAQSAIREALTANKTTLKISAVRRQHEKLQFSLSVVAGSATGADLFAVLAQKRATSVVARGENGGRTLTHVSVAKNIEDLGPLNELKDHTQEFEVPIGKTEPLAGFRLIVFLQQNGKGRVLGVTAYDLSTLKE